MTTADSPSRPSRRALLFGLAAGGVALALVPGGPGAAELPLDEILALTGGRLPERSARLQLDMPKVFANGYTVPITITVASPMTDADHVRQVTVLAPGNPFLEVATFRFTPRSGRAHVSTRIRLAEPQQVHAVAELSGGRVLLASTWVEVATNGCAG